jgi:hypothetical protein
VERARGIYSFSHLTFQEFFTAKYVVDNARKGTLDVLVSKYLTDPKWREVFLITAGLLPNAEDFLIMIAESVKSIIPEEVEINLNKVSVEDLYTELPEALFHPSFIKSVLLEFNFVRMSEAQWISNVARLSEKVYCLLQGHTTFERSNDKHSFIRDDDYAVCRNLLDAHPRIALARRDIVLTHMAHDSTMSYMQANLILLDCLFTGCYVSKETRETILNDLFTKEATEYPSVPNQSLIS